jgi:DNA-binding NarL/FixJ family response regulator
VIEGTCVKESLVRRARAINAGDAPKAAEFITRSTPVPGRLARLLPGLLHQLISEEVLSGVVVEHIRDGHVRPELAAVGLSGFVSETWADSFLASPAPHIELILLDLASRDAQGPAFLTHDEIAQANAGDSLTLVPLLWLQVTEDYDDPEAHVLLRLGQQNFLSRHRGYRLTRIIKEMWAERAFAFQGGGFQEHCRIPAGTPLSFNPEAALGRDHIIFTVTRQEVEANWPGTAVGLLFAHEPPRCGFTRAEQQVLTLAADGLTDARIAQDLGISAAAVSMRWRSIYTRFLEGAPLALRFEEASTGARGLEKRRHVIGFVSEHPEELRPYARPARRNGKNGD